MPRLGPTELIIILVIILVIFGAGKLPQIGGAIGKSIREFRKAKEGDDAKAEAKTEDKTSATVQSGTTAQPAPTEEKKS